MQRPSAAVFDSTKYPGYTGAIAVKGYVIVEQMQDAVGLLKLSYSLKGLENGVAGGLHIHTGTSCQASGPHYFDKDLIYQDPWSTKYKPTSGGVTEGSFLVRAGLTLQDVMGRAIVIHDSSGSRVACALISNDPEEISPIKLQISLSGLELGKEWWRACLQWTCDTPGNHYFAESANLGIAGDPWNAIKYTSDQSGVAASDIMVFSGTTQKSLTDGDGKIVVVHDSAGKKVACGKLVTAYDVTPSGRPCTARLAGRQE